VARPFRRLSRIVFAVRCSGAPRSELSDPPPNTQASFSCLTAFIYHLHRVAIMARGAVPALTADATGLGPLIPITSPGLLLMTADPSTAHRATLRDELFNRFFLIAAGSAGLTPTSAPCGPPCPTSRGLTPATHSPCARDCRNREPEIKLIMAGHDATPAQWFHRPLKRRDFELDARWYSEQYAIKVFPHELWQSITDSQCQSGDDICPSIDVWGFPEVRVFLLECAAFCLRELAGRSRTWSRPCAATSPRSFKQRNARPPRFFSVALSEGLLPSMKS